MAHPINPGRLILATLLAPTIGAFSTILTLVILDPGTINGSYDLFHFIAVIGGLIALLIGLPTMLIVGLPIHGWLCHKNLRHWTRYAGFGAIAGLVPALAFGIFDGAIGFLMIAIGAAAGSLTAVLFHLIRGPHLQTNELATQTP